MAFPVIYADLVQTVGPDPLNIIWEYMSFTPGVTCVYCHEGVCNNYYACIACVRSVLSCVRSLAATQTVPRVGDVHMWLVGLHLGITSPNSQPFIEYCTTTYETLRFRLFKHVSYNIQIMAQCGMNLDLHRFTSFVESNIGRIHLRITTRRRQLMSKLEVVNEFKNEGVMVQASILSALKEPADLVMRLNVLVSKIKTTKCHNKKSERMGRLKRRVQKIRSWYESEIENLNTIVWTKEVVEAGLVDIMGKYSMAWVFELQP